MTSMPTPFIVRITRNLPIAEKILLAALTVGTILTIMNIDSSVTKVSLIGLAITFFLYAYRPTDMPMLENEQPGGFSELLGLVIVPKVMWIGSSVSALGIALYLMNLGNDGYKRMLMIGGSCIGLTLALTIYSLVTGVKHLKIVSPTLLRSVPLLMIDLYIFLT